MRLITTRHATRACSHPLIVVLGIALLAACGNEQGASAGTGPGNDPDIGTIADQESKADDSVATDSVTAGDSGGAVQDIAAAKKDAGMAVQDSGGGAVDSGSANANDAVIKPQDAGQPNVQDTGAGSHDAGSQPVDAGPAQTGLNWYKTCGAPVCLGGPWQPTPGVPECTKGEKVGDACGSAGVMCDNKDGCKAFLVCAAKDPKQGPGGCPISRRSFKTDIRYLTPADEAGYARELSDLQLSTWAYRQGDGRTHLGFILDDAPASVAVDGARDRVDLYSYISMAVAALKVQQREIRQLRREIRHLRGDINPASLRCE